MVPFSHVPFRIPFLGTTLGGFSDISVKPARGYPLINPDKPLVGISKNPSGNALILLYVLYRVLFSYNKN